MKTPVLSLAIVPSKYVASYLISLHALIVLSLCYLALPTLAISLLVMVIISHGVYCLWRFCYAGHKAWVDSIQYSQQAWLLYRAGYSEWVDLRSATVWRWLIVLNFRSETGRCCPVVLLPDSSSPELLRQLRVLLKHKPVYKTGGINP
ncbi:protein YgfX [Oceanicoccus sagamiensis]|uniref:Toxin CptA n=1 Tax=Oceanicoccus sagamiensis TaxID=716816 RepID=A0A1X9NBD6_9GAMM|nr:protein YgfX [Oceanicoccus sagamiensis]ARN75348.1 hypothetical protein BST96_15245 [Oceanicoccus sagamiensis]